VKILGRNLYLIVFAITQMLLGCGVPSYESAATGSKNLSVVIDQVNADLTRRDCAAAISRIEPIFQSEDSNNEVRQATAGAYGCFTGLDMFDILSDLVNFQGNLAGSGFFEFSVRKFPSTASPDDRIPQAAKNGMDATLSILKPGTILLPAYLITTDANNTQSILAADRVDDANSYLPFISMALLGSLLYRYGQPFPNYHKSTTLPWITPTTVTVDGCAVASAIVNFNDGLRFISTNAAESVRKVYTDMRTLFEASMDTACSQGCATVCGDASLCTSCPTTLRNRNSCTFLATDPNSCAAAGLTNFFINAIWSGPP
jgi:hypothetical protein